MKSEKNVGVILSLSANKVNLKIDVHYEDSREVGPNSSLSITVNVRHERSATSRLTKIRGVGG